MKDFVFATGLKTSIGLPRKQVEQTPPKVSDPHLGSDSVDGLDADTSMHSSSLSKYRGDIFTAGGAMY